MFGDREKLGGNRFKVELERFRDRKEVDNGKFEVKSEPLLDREERDDDGFEVKSEPLAERDDEFETEVKKTHPQDREIDWDNLTRGDEWRRDKYGWHRGGVGWDPFYWLNNKYVYVIIGGFGLGSIIGFAIATTSADRMPDSEIVEYGALVGTVLGVACCVYLIYKNRRARNELDDLDDDDL
jgi:hypothetical protein